MPIKIDKYEGAFALPPALPKVAKEKKVREAIPSVAGYWGTKDAPFRPEKPLSIPKKLKNGMNDFPPDNYSLANIAYAHDGLGKVTRDDKGDVKQALFDYVCSAIYHTGRFQALARATNWEEKLQGYRPPAKVKTQAQLLRWISLVKRWAAENPAKYADEAQIQLSALIQFSNSKRIHPVDVASWFTWWMDEAGGKSAGIGTLEFSTISSILTSIGKSTFSIQRNIGKMVLDFLGLKGGYTPAFYTLAKARPWAAGVESLKEEILGMEVVEVEYLVPTEFDASGEPTAWVPIKHETTSAIATKTRSGNDDSKQALAALSRSVAGRLYLCFSQNMQNVFFATSFAPKQPLFALNEFLPHNSAVRGEPDVYVTGLIV